MLTDLASARVIFLGEFHDRQEHHSLQLAIIKALRARGVPLAIGLEMFDLESQPALDQWTAGALSLPDFVGRYQQNWTIPWDQYDTILLFARNNRVPLVALDPPAAIVRTVTHHGFASLSSSDLARLPEGVNVSQSGSYREFLRGPFAGHQLPEQFFANFCEAQALRNSTMALITRRYLTQHPDRVMVILTGVGHAMRRAAAATVADNGAVTTRIVVPLVPGLLDVLEMDDADYFVSE